MSEKFDNDYYEWNSQKGDRPALTWYSNLLRKQIKSGKILDYGCGTGTLISKLSRNYDVDGFEVSKFAERQAMSLNPSSAIYSDLDSVKNLSGYSAVVSIHVLEHISNDEVKDTISLWGSILCKKGLVLIATPDFGGAAHRRKKSNWDAFADSTHINLKSSMEWDAIFERSGFRKIRSYTDGLWSGPYFTKAKIEKYFLLIPIAIQIFTGWKVIPCGFGESYVALYEKCN
jgi:SAM-dependent methyltransferase